ncbi:uncharacterized protein LOC111299029 [Durio zibethinus]|uniref:Uncharacterized protein LOC111299029 n=1 Tax=Durio zibethinus TaxID=66656 RepID=A0A6P5ZB81_DURZI|nr:uncharacterized protein LOC111299029 [Durio zibethinus]XP_022749638.1 uncharacterized protein LOC111299029 [Durio zibethinus]XP_022749639.1 uncharacterized protein LOC111299029 [Durio zibethinus]XP_022749641.1 uncharacterized protein LOC111299029 [Durio zibethinus]
MAKREGSGSGNLRFARPTVAEKLWDGSLQLNSSVTVSVVAFFKSGEKMPDIKWSELVQVKGKVRLEAFEKYIQELARSRNRGLMVVSLCWKEGSSKSGLAGLKEIAKGYEKGERVGFAQLSPGIDLYICPRSDAIITILAKHGFFKGMAAVEDKQNSLVGCVVWRRNHGPSNSVTRKLERKHSSLTEQPLNSRSEQKLLENDLPCTQPAQESHLATCTSIGSAIINRNEGDNVVSNDIQLELHNSPASANLLLTTSALSNFSSTSEGLQTSSCSNSVSVFGPKEQSSERGMSLTANAGTEKPKSGLGLQNPVLSLPSVITKVHTPAIDDDDLPEFDFGAACGISESLRNKVLDTAVFDKNVFVEGLKKIVGSLPLTLPTIQSLPAPHKRRAENFLLPEFPYDAILNLPPGKKVCEHDQISMLPALEMKQTTKSGTTFTPVITTIVAPQKNIFDDDDDDMPEWCPPNVELLKHTFLEPEKVVASVYPTLSNSKSSSSPGHPGPSFCSLATQLPFSTRRSNYRNHWPITASVKPAQRRQTDGYIQRAPSSLMDSNSSDLLRPPLHTPGWRGRGR